MVDTDSGLGKAIWEGYLSMQPAKLSLDPSNFRDATNTFLNFLHGQGSRDSWQQVRDLPKILE